MKIHYIQHEPFEDLGCIREWMQYSNHTITHTHIFENEPFPKANDIDFLIIMGGSMGANDDEVFDWMPLEKMLISDCINQNKLVLGICLGAQLLAAVLGAKVFANQHKEIGWFEIKLNDNAKQSKLFSSFPTEFITMHWHGDTFEIPQGASMIASSEATKNQAFTYNNEKVVGLQFHPEMTQKAIEGMIDETGELKKDTYIQDIEEIKSKFEFCIQNNQMMFEILDNISNKF